MTVAKPAHIRARRLAIAGMHIPPDAVGIVGDTSHVGGGTSYHLGKDDLDLDRHPYSVFESSRDRNGLDNHASAMDFGKFQRRTDRGTFDLLDFNRWLVGLCQANDPDTRDIREVIYTPDGKVVRRFDRLGKRSSGDSSHLFHTHVSEFRDATGARMEKLIQRFVDFMEGVDVPITDDDVNKVWGKKAREYRDEDGGGIDDRTALDILYATHRAALDALAEARAEKLRSEAILAAVRGLDTSAVLARINEVASQETARDAELRALVEQGNSGQLDAEEVVRRMGELLSADTPPPPGG